MKVKEWKLQRLHTTFVGVKICRLKYNNNKLQREHVKIMKSETESASKQGVSKSTGLKIYKMNQMAKTLHVVWTKSQGVNATVLVTFDYIIFTGK